ncbi:MAG TPA: PIN domain-containing protein [Thermoanaerobaculia bacterium]|nr:PIN domain-containing protein [Thermoanaerobaculia bacterium]
MIAVDTSTLRRFLDKISGADTARLQEAIAAKTARLPPVVVAECLSDPGIDAGFARDLLALPVLELRIGFWERAGRLRARVRAGGHKASLAGTLIAQSCMDHNVPLITHDRDFRHFVKAGLKLL